MLIVPSSHQIDHSQLISTEVWYFAGELPNYRTNELNLQKDFTIVYSALDIRDEQKISFFRDKYN